LRDDEDQWVFARDGRGRVVSEAGQILGGSDE